MPAFFQPSSLNLPFTDFAETSKVIEKSAKRVFIDLKPFTFIHLKCTVKEQDTIHKNEPIAFDVHEKNRIFLSPFTGKIVKIHRGEKRKIQSIEIEKENAESKTLPPLDLNLEKSALLQESFARGAGFIIKKRPFDIPINIQDFPKSIFINKIAYGPFDPPFSYIEEGNKHLFDSAIAFLKKFSKVHIITDKLEETSLENNYCDAFSQKKSPLLHSLSSAIAAIDPIKEKNEVIWTLNFHEALQLGALIKGEVFNEKIVAICGKGFHEQDRVLVKTDIGADICNLMHTPDTFFSGDPLTGKLYSPYIRQKDFCIFGINQNEKMEILPFVKPGFNKFSTSRTFLGRFIRKKSSLKMHFKKTGEMRPFVVKDLYKDFLPLNIAVEPLIKALIVKDYDLAISYGFLHLCKEDLALCEYACPSKIPFMHTFEKAVKRFLELNAE